MKQKITISDIARLAGVSKTTISFYLNGKYDKMSETTRQKIAQVIAKTGYEPNTMARSLNAKSTHLIGVIIGDISNTFANQIVKGIESYTRTHGYQMIVGSSNYLLENEKKCMQGMDAMGVDGYIVQPTTQFDTIWQNSGIDKPLVYFDSPNPDTHGFWVKTNNYEAVYNATEKMTEKGYEQYVMITADPYVLNTRIERNKGFIDCLKQKQLPYEIITADETTSTGTLETELSPYLNTNRSTCIFVCNNWLLDTVYLVVRKYQELIPRYIGLVGFDSLQWTQLAVPSITTIVQPAFEEGRSAAEILIDQIEGRHAYTPTRVLCCHLNELDSTTRNK